MQGIQGLQAEEALLRQKWAIKGSDHLRPPVVGVVKELILMIWALL